MKLSTKSTTAHLLKNFIFGVEDSLVSTVGLLSGIAVGGLPRSEIFLAGVVLIFVEAFSMGVGSYLSEDFAEAVVHPQNHTTQRSILGALIMLFSYFFAGFVPLSPYLFFPTSSALYLSITFSLLSLFLLGAVSAKKFKVSIFSHGIKMLFIGGTAIIIGVVVGTILNV